MSTEIVAELGKRSAIPLQIRLMPWEQAYLAAQRARKPASTRPRASKSQRLFPGSARSPPNQWVLISNSDFAGSVKAVEGRAQVPVGVVARDAKIEFLMSKGVTDLREVSEDGLNPPRLVLGRDDPNRIDLWATSATARARPQRVRR